MPLSVLMPAPVMTAILRVLCRNETINSVDSFCVLLMTGVFLSIGLSGTNLTYGLDAKLAIPLDITACVFRCMSIVILASLFLLLQEIFSSAFLSNHQKRNGMKSDLIELI